MRTVATFLGGGFVGTFLGHFLAIGRERRTRKTEFYEWTTEWKSRIDHTNVSQEIVTIFLDKRDIFAGKASAIEQDLRWWKRDPFRKSAENVTGMNVGDVGRQEDKSRNDLMGNSVLGAALVNVIAFVR